MIIPEEFEYVSPSSISEASREIMERDAVVFAGGTDLVPMFKEKLVTPKVVVNLKKIPGMDGISFDKASLTIGALTTLTSLATHPSILEKCPGIGKAAKSVASPQIRNVGTVGGNLCQNLRCPYFRQDFPCHKRGGKKCFAVGGDNYLHSIFGAKKCFAVNPSDLATILVAYDSKVILESMEGIREVFLEDFYLGPGEFDIEKGEILKEVVISSENMDSALDAFLKFRIRQSIDFALVNVGIVLKIQNRLVEKASVVLGAVAGTPYRAVESEKVLAGNDLTKELIEEAAHKAVEKAKPLSKNEYKVDVARILIKRALEEIMERAL